MDPPPVALDEQLELELSSGHVISFIFRFPVPLFTRRFDIGHLFEYVGIIFYYAGTWGQLLMQVLVELERAPQYQDRHGQGKLECKLDCSAP